MREEPKDFFDWCENRVREESQPNMIQCLRKDQDKCSDGDSKVITSGYEELLGYSVLSRVENC